MSKSKGEKERTTIWLHQGTKHRIKELISEGKYFSYSDFFRTAIKNQINKEEG